MSEREIEYLVFLVFSPNEPGYVFQIEKPLLSETVKTKFIQEWRKSYDVDSIESFGKFKILAFSNGYIEWNKVCIILTDIVFCILQSNYKLIYCFDLVHIQSNIT
jgi:hypothetical protein